MPQPDDINSIITAIDNMQKSERLLYIEKARLTAQNPTISIAEEAWIDDLISKAVSARTALWNSILDRSEIINAGITDAENSLSAQIALLEVTRQELENANTQLTNKKGNNDTMARMLQINTYYGSKFEAKTDLLKLAITVLALLIILVALKSYGYIPDTINNVLTAIIVTIGVIMIIRSIWDIETRSSMNFDEYDWKYEDPGTRVPSIWEYNKKHFFNFDNPMKVLSENLGICIGEGCCNNGMYYNNSTQKCTSGTPKQTESFTSGSLTGIELFSNTHPSGQIHGFNSTSKLGNMPL